jgi:hypothetical protein
MKGDTMEGTVLERRPVSVAVVENDRKFRELAAKAQKALKYGRLNTLLSQKDNGVALDETLTKLDIQPFKTSTVNAYKDEMLFGKFWNKHPRLAFFADIGMVMTGIFSVVAMIASIIASFNGIAIYITVPIALTGCAVLVGAVKVFRSYNGTPAARHFDWYQIELDDYSEDVPEFALHTALRISQLLPDARFFVEHLGRLPASSRQQNRVRSLDPFLIVAHGDKTYYVEVWDEPNFEAENLYRS